MFINALYWYYSPTFHSTRLHCALLHWTATYYTTLHGHKHYFKLLLCTALNCTTKTWSFCEYVAVFCLQYGLIWIFCISLFPWISCYEIVWPFYVNCCAVFVVFFCTFRNIFWHLGTFFLVILREGLKKTYFYPHFVDKRTPPPPYQPLGFF